MNKKSPNKNKLWDGRFEESTDAFVEAFTASVSFDSILASHDIEGSIAHAKMLEAAGILNKAELDKIVSGLKKIKEDIDKDTFEWSVSLEDVHMNIEFALTERIGETGKKLHTARSRNDQIATDLRLYLRQAIDETLTLIRKVQQGILNLAEGHSDTIMPGYTHLQVAQPVTFGHHLMAWFEMIDRDYERFLDCRKRVNVMPLGAAALAGTSWPIDRGITAELLKFDGISQNSLDAVSDRDSAIEFTAVASILMMHLSRWSEEMILWASSGFEFISLPDRFCTGSSIMPQKKNPDVPELVRGKSGRTFGHLISLLTLMKGQPLAYNKDNQEDKEPVFDTVITIQSCLRAFADMIPAIQPDKERMYEAAKKGYATATDLADYLVGKGMAFRDAHEVVGKLVGVAIARKCDLSELALSELQKGSDIIDQDVFDVLTLEGSVKARDHVGGTAPSRVEGAIKLAQTKIDS